MRFEITECCACCENEVALQWNVNTDGFEIFCPYCGEKMMLCDECQHSEGFTWCDWCEEKGCWRKRLFEKKNFEKCLTTLKYDFTEFSERTYNKVKYAYDLMSADELIGKVYCGEICFELCLDFANDTYSLCYNTYCPRENSDYGFSKDVGNYDSFDGGCLASVVDLEELDYEKFKESFKREVCNILKENPNKELLLSSAKKPVVRW